MKTDHDQYKNETRNQSEVQLEYLGRGLVAAVTSEGVFLSWRLLGNEVSGFSSNGLTGTDFNLYRDGSLIAVVCDSTNYLDPGGTPDSVYYVCAVVDGQEVDRSADVNPWEGPYYEIPLQKPADGITPTGQTFTYSANDMSVGDVDGDGEYEFLSNGTLQTRKMYRTPATPDRCISTVISWTERCYTGLT